VVRARRSSTAVYAVRGSEDARSTSKIAEPARCSQPEPAGWLRDKSYVIGGWLRRLTCPLAFNKMKTIIFLFTLAATYAFAGSELKFTCENPECKFQAKCKSGGGKLFEQLTGYCCTCKKFVSISWNRKDTPPQNLKTIWVPQDLSLPGHANLFPCPACTNYVYEFQTDGSPTNRFSCPQCKHHTLKKETLMFYD
jgi:hypothetical protein